MPDLSNVCCAVANPDDVLMFGRLVTVFKYLGLLLLFAFHAVFTSSDRFVPRSTECYQILTPPIDEEGPISIFLESKTFLSRFRGPSSWKRSMNFAP
jgi:hypothetical protein